MLSRSAVTPTSRHAPPLPGRILTASSTAAGSRLTGTTGETSMRDTDLMQLALGLIPPWLVKACAFDAEKRRLDIEIDFARGGRFPCPQCGTADCPGHHTSLQEGRRLDFFPHQALPPPPGARHTPPPRGPKQNPRPWGRGRSR